MKLLGFYAERTALFGDLFVIDVVDVSQIVTDAKVDTRISKARPSWCFANNNIPEIAIHVKDTEAHTNATILG